MVRKQGCEADAVATAVATAVDRKSLLGGVRRLVVKVGTRVITGPTRDIDTGAIGRIAEDVAVLRDRKIEVAVVTSGAIGAGMGRLGLTARPRSVADLQAVAAVGQNLLMHHYEHAFGSHGMAIGQVLLTAGDLRDRGRYVNALNTLRALFQFRVVPIINENDSVAVDEIKVGDNDTLSAYVANLIRADLLVILSDVDGLYSADPRKDPSGFLIPVVEGAGGLEEVAIGKSGSDVGVGGMRTKIEAARIVTASGEMMVIANGRKTRIADILDGQDVGTLFLPRSGKLAGRKRWIAFASDKKGAVVVDDGAAWALLERGKSLLASGVVDVRGQFEGGEMVAVETADGVEFARGLSRCSSEELLLAKGKRSSEVLRILHRSCDEVIHRDDLVVL